MTKVISLRGRRSAVTSTTTNDPDTIRLHAQAENALSMALHYLRRPESNARGAGRKVVQALAALNLLQRRG